MARVSAWLNTTSGQRRILKRYYEYRKARRVMILDAWETAKLYREGLVD